MIEKRLLSAMTATAMIGTALPFLQNADHGTLSASAASITKTHEFLIAPQDETGEINNLCYIKHPDYVEFTECTDTSITSIEIPAEIDGVPVTTLRDHLFRSCKRLKEISIPDTVTHLSKATFSDTPWYSTLRLQSDFVIINHVLIDYSESDTETELLIPDGVVTIATYAISPFYCKRIVIPDSVQHLEAESITSCYEAEDIVIPETLTDIRYGVFSDSPWLEADLQNGCKIVNGVLIYAEEQEEIVIPDGVTTIGEGVFYNHYSLESVTIPDTVTSIQDSAFFYCMSLRKIELPPNLTYLGRDAFAYTEIEHLHFPAFLTSAETSWFGMTALKEITVDSENPAYTSSDGILYDKNMETLYCYGRMNKATEYIMPSTVKEIYCVAFENNSFLQTVVCSDVLEIINADAFSNCFCLENIELPESLKYIGNSAFDSCDVLQKIVIPDQVAYLGKSAFSLCNSLSEVILQGGLKGINSLTFAFCPNLHTIYIPDTIESIDFTAFLYTGIQSFDVDENNPVYSDADGVLMSKDQTILYFYPPGKIGSTYEVPATVKIIGAESFMDVSQLKEITFHEGLLEIEQEAFANTSLSNLTLPDSLRVIGCAAFTECDELQSITLPKWLSSVGDGCFANCSSLTEVVIEMAVNHLNLQSLFTRCGCLSDITVLNPDCIPQHVAELQQDDDLFLTLHGLSGSETEIYAAEYGIPFTACEKPIVEQNYIQGDVTGNGVVDICDAIWVLRYINEDRDLNYENVQLDAADCDGREGLDAADANWIVSRIARLN